MNFFVDESALDTLGENNSSKIKKIFELLSKGRSISNEFDNFLLEVVEADIGQESEVEGETAKNRRQRVMKDKYGERNTFYSSKIKFSISHIEWLEEEMPHLLL